MRQKNVELNTVFCLFFSGIDSFFIIISKRHIYNAEFRLMEQHIKKKFSFKIKYDCKHYGGTSVFHNCNHRLINLEYMIPIKETRYHVLRMFGIPRD